MHGVAPVAPPVNSLLHSPRPPVISLHRAPASLNSEANSTATTIAHSVPPPISSLPISDGAKCSRNEIDLMVTLESARTEVAARPCEEQGAPVCSLNAPPSNEILEQDRAREVDAGKGIWAWLWAEENLSAKNKPPQHQKLQHADTVKPPPSRDRNASDHATVVVVTPPPPPPRQRESSQPSCAARAHPSTRQPSTPQPSGIEQHGYDGNEIDLLFKSMMLSPG